MVNNARYVFKKDSLTRLIIFGYLNISTKTRVSHICKNKCEKQISHKRRINYDINKCRMICVNMNCTCIDPKQASFFLEIIKMYNRTYDQLPYKMILTRKKRVIVEKYVENMILNENINHKDITNKKWAISTIECHYKAYKTRTRHIPHNVRKISFCNFVFMVEEDFKIYNTISRSDSSSSGEIYESDEWSEFEGESESESESESGSYEFESDDY
jgi:hypothetical protein